MTRSGRGPKKTSTSSSTGKGKDHPIGTFLHVSWRGGTHRAQIIEKRQSVLNPKETEFYVHYTNFVQETDPPPGSVATEAPANDTTKTQETLSVNDAIPQATATTAGTPQDTARKLTRNMKRKYEAMNLQSLSQIDPKFLELEKEREELTKVKNIDRVFMGRFEIGTWYFSPYPDEFGAVKDLYVCEFCLKYMKLGETWVKHQNECSPKAPPGKRVYAKDNHAVFEVDGKTDKLYCQLLCLLCKLFLDHKTVYYDIEPFLFYVLTEKEMVAGKPVYHVVGYFSKEKNSIDGFNLACILVLPQHQRKGYGRMLIEFSYELSKIEKKVGSPERPLSDLGLVGYRSYWQSVLMSILKDNKNQSLTVRELSILTSIRQEDIVSTLSSMDMIRLWKGEHTICVTPAMVRDYLAEHKVSLERKIDPTLIHYTPLVIPSK